MRRTLLTALPLLLSLPLAAQGFQGTIEMRMTSPEMPEPVNTTMYIKGDLMAMAMKLPASAGPMGGLEARVVLDQGARKITMFMPMPPGMGAMPGSKGIKIVQDMATLQDAAGSGPEPTIKKLSTSQTIAGISCDDYQVTTGNDTMNMCATDKLGRFALPSGMGATAPTWARAFGDKPMFPLKVWTTTSNNAVAMEVLSVKRGAPPAAHFDTSAEGYMDASGMMGGMGRRNN